MFFGPFWRSMLCVCVCVCLCEGSPTSPGSLMTSIDLSSLFLTPRSGCSCGTLRDRNASGASSPVTSATPQWPWLCTTSQVSQFFDSSLFFLMCQFQLNSTSMFSVCLFFFPPGQTWTPSSRHQSGLRTCGRREEVMSSSCWSAIKQTWLIRGNTKCKVSFALCVCARVWHVPAGDVT